MKIQFADKEYKRLYTDVSYNGKENWSADILKSYRKKITLIKDVRDRRDLYRMKSLHLDKKTGKRKHQHAIWINRQWRIIIEFTKSSDGEIVVIIKIEDYHK